MEKEIWCPIVGYEGLYEVSSFGRVKNNRNKILKILTNNNGYLKVVLCKNGIVRGINKYFNSK